MVRPPVLRSPQTPGRPILRLQRASGNRAVGGLLEAGRLQARFRISGPGEVGELEANRAAERVMGGSAVPQGRRVRARSEGGSPGRGGERGADQRAAALGGGTLDAGVSSEFLPSLGPGRPMDGNARALMETRFGQWFGDVVVHADVRAAETAQAFDALAFTVGRHIVFGAGRYEPASPGGQRLLAHELAHVSQARGAGTSASAPVIQRQQPTEAERAEMERRLRLMQVGRRGPYGTYGPGVMAPVLAEAGRPVAEPIMEAGEAVESAVEYLADTPAGELNVGEQLLAGALIGDFREDHTFWTTVGQIVVGFIPYAGQVADVRDLIAGLDRIINEGGWRSPWEWLNLLLILIGFIPGLGDIIKGTGRAGIRWLRRRRIIGAVVEWLDAQVVRRAVDALQPVVDRIVNRIKSETQRLIDGVAERVRQAIEGRQGAAARELAERRYRAQLEQALGEAEERAAQRGRAALDDVTEPRLRQWVEADARRRELAYDPAHRGFTNQSVREAQAGIAAESQGILRRPIRRDLTGGAEFVDGAGRHWDVKRPVGRSLDQEANSIVAELTGTNHSVLLDSGAIDRAYRRRLLAEVRSRLATEGREDLMDRITVLQAQLSQQTVRTTRIVTRRATESEGGGEE